MANTRLQTWITQEEKQKWEKTADDLGMNFPDFVREAMNLLSSFHPDFWQRIRARSQRLGISPSILIQNTIARRMADDMASDEVYGPAPRVLPELVFTEEGPVPFPELLESLTNNTVRQNEREKAENLRRDKGYGVQLPQEEEEWLLNYSQRRELPARVSQMRRFFTEKKEEK